MGCRLCIVFFQRRHDVKAYFTLVIAFQCSHEEDDTLIQQFYSCKVLFGIVCEAGTYSVLSCLFHVARLH